MKFQYIGDYSGCLTRSHLCRLMGVTERGLHAWKHRPQSQRQRRDMVLLAHIRDQHRLSLGSYGRPRMAAEAAVPKTVMIDATYLKAHRTATSLRSKKGGRVTKGAV